MSEVDEESDGLDCRAFFALAGRCEVSSDLIVGVVCTRNKREQIACACCGDSNSICLEAVDVF